MQISRLVGIAMLSLCVTSSLFSLTTEDNLYQVFEQFIDPIHSYKIEQLKGGFTDNQQYLCTVNEKKYVVRVLSNSYTQRKSEIVTHLYFANQSIAPRVHYYANDYSFIIMDFIEGNTLTFQDARKECVLKNVADTIYRVHVNEIDDALKKDIGRRCLRDDITRWYNAIKKNNHTLPVLIDDAFVALEGICNYLEKEAGPLVMSHNDIHLRNIFFQNNTIILIDWEMIQLNYAFYDMAVYSIYACLSDDQEYYFLTQYLKRKPTFSERQCFKNTKLLALLWSVFGWLDFLGPISDTISNIEDFSYYAATFAGNTEVKDSLFLFELAFSLLRKFFEEYKSCNNMAALKYIS